MAIFQLRSFLFKPPHLLLSLTLCPYPLPTTGPAVSSLPDVHLLPTHSYVVIFSRFLKLPFSGLFQLSPIINQGPKLPGQNCPYFLNLCSLRASWTYHFYSVFLFLVLALMDCSRVRADGVGGGGGKRLHESFLSPKKMFMMSR